MKSKRSSTVEPVIGTLTQYLGMQKVNVRGLAQANKVMHMAATAYNLKKLLKWEQNRRKTGVMSQKLLDCIKMMLGELNRWLEPSANSKVKLVLVKKK